MSCNCLDVEVLESGIQGLSAYEVYVQNGGQLSEEEWLASLKGENGADGYTPVKGTDYWTAEDVNEIKSYVDEQIDNIDFSDYATKEEIPDVSNFITSEVDNLTNYELKTNTGTSIELSIDNSTYIMTMNLKNSDGTVLSSGTVDLPLETMVINASYDNATKEIVLTLKSGATTRFSVADLVSGLVNTDDLNALLATKQDTLTAGTNITIENGEISATDTTYDVATSNSDGLMSSTDKEKLDDIDMSALSPTYILNLSNYCAGNYTFSEADKTNMAKIINDAYSKGYYLFQLNAVDSKSNFEKKIIPFIFTPNSNNTIQQKPASYSLVAVRPRSNLTYISLVGVYSYKLDINLSWNEDVATVTSGSIIMTEYTPLSPNNETRYNVTGSYNPAHKKYVDDKFNSIDLSSKQDVMQYAEMPVASAESIGDVIQYVGTTNNTYINGYFYVGTSETVEENGEEVTIYSWSNIDVQDKSGQNVYIFKDLTLSSPQTFSKTYTDEGLIEFLKNCKNNNENGLLIMYVENNNTMIIPIVGRDYFGVVAYICGGFYNVDFKKALSITLNEQNGEVTSVTISSNTNPNYNKQLLYSDYNIWYMRANNTKSYNVTSDYNPAHKKYVDDSIANIDLSSYATTSYVDSQIASAISDAIGGEY